MAKVPFKTITVDEIIATKEQNPDKCIFSLAPKDRHKTNNNERHKTHYIPIYFNCLDGKQYRPAIKAISQLLCSSAKIPAGTSDEDAIDMRITFRKVSEDDLVNTDWKKGTYKELLNNNDKLIKALQIIDTDYKICAKEAKKLHKALKKETFSICQEKRNAVDDEVGDDDNKIKLDIPLYRLRLPAIKGNKPRERKLMKSYGKDKTPEPYVYDTSKRSHNGKAVPATIKTINKKKKVKYVDLNIENAAQFITNMSLATFVLVLDSICISKHGASLKNQISEIHIKHHKKVVRKTIDENDFNDMNKFGMDERSDNDDSVENHDDENISDDNDDNDVDDDNDDNSSEEGEEEDSE